MSLTEPSIMAKEPALVFGNSLPPPPPQPAATSVTMTMMGLMAIGLDRRGSVGVGRDDLPARPCADAAPDADVDRALDEPDRTVGEQKVHPAAVVTPRGGGADLIRAVVEDLARVAVVGLRVGREDVVVHRLLDVGVALRAGPDAVEGALVRHGEELSLTQGHELIGRHVGRAL